MKLGTTEIILILALVIILFGGGKIAGLGKAFGTSIRDFKKEMREDKADVEGVVATEESTVESMSAQSDEGNK